MLPSARIVKHTKTTPRLRIQSKHVVTLLFALVLPAISRVNTTFSASAWALSSSAVNSLNSLSLTQLFADLPSSQKNLGFLKTLFLPTGTVHHSLGKKTRTTPLMIPRLLRTQTSRLNSQASYAIVLLYLHRRLLHLPNYPIIQRT